MDATGSSSVSQPLAGSLKSSMKRRSRASGSVPGEAAGVPSALAVGSAGVATPKDGAPAVPLGAAVPGGVTDTQPVIKSATATNENSDFGKWDPPGPRCYAIARNGAFQQVGAASGDED